MPKRRLNLLFGADAGERLNASDAGTDAGLRHDDEDADASGGIHVGAAAEFVAPWRVNLDRTDVVFVGFAEERERALFDGFPVSGPVNLDGEVFRG